MELSQILPPLKDNVHFAAAIKSSSSHSMCHSAENMAMSTQCISLSACQRVSSCSQSLILCWIFVVEDFDLTSETKSHLPASDPAIHKCSENV